MSADASEVLEKARGAALACGVTRLADITRLDRIGVPVFHAVRPLSRALTLAQGKGLTVPEAQIGALMESVESAYAEAFDRRDRGGPWRDLPPDARPSDLTDFAVDRAAAPGPDQHLAWTRAERLADGSPLYVPLDCVSLDCTADWDHRLDRTSNGLAARFDEDTAVLKGLLEVLERDALAAWRRRPPVARAADAIAAAGIPYPWFREISGRLYASGVRLSLYRVPGMLGLPVIAAELRGSDAEPAFSGRKGGWACAPSAEAALQGAVLEALQCRLTAIAGARDDILYPDEEAAWRGDGFPLPPHMRALDWSAVADAAPGDAAPDARRLARRLAAEGYPDAAVVRLTGPPADPVCVVKVFAPGLGAFRRARRAGR